MRSVVSLFHNPFNKWIHVICSGEFTTESLTQALLDSVYALNTHKCHDVILDFQLAWGADLLYDWINTTWIEIAQENGLKNLTLVYGTHYPKLFNHPLWISRMGFYPCQNLSSAVKWLSAKG
jgi:hypothetical protein